MLTDPNLITTIKTLQELIVILILACFDLCINSGSKGDKFTSARSIRKYLKPRNSSHQVIKNDFFP